MKFLIFVLFFASASASAASFFVEPTTGSGVPPADLDTSTDLIRNSVPQVEGQVVSDNPAGADYTLRSRLLRLGGSYVLLMEKIKGDSVVFSSQMKAKDIEELDQVANRLTRAVIIATTPSDDIRVGEVTKQEATEGMARTPARRGSFLGFGPTIFSSTMNTSYNIAAYFSGGYYWDVNYFMAKILFDFATNGDAIFTNAGLGGYYFLTNKNTTPYIAADFGGGFAKAAGGGIFSGPSVGGFVLGGGTGVQFLRTSTINMEIGFRVSVLLNQLNGSAPALYALKLGFYF